MFDDINATKATMIVQIPINFVSEAVAGLLGPIKVFQVRW
jgi:hypothetical protein